MSTAPLLDEGTPDTGHRQVLDRLVERAALGDRTAFERFFDLTAQRVYRAELVRARGRAPVAERAARDRYLTAWTSARSYRHSGLSPLAWLMSLPVRSDPEASTREPGARRGV